MLFVVALLFCVCWLLIDVWCSSFVFVFDVCCLLRVVCCVLFRAPCTVFCVLCFVFVVCRLLCVVC